MLTITYEKNKDKGCPIGHTKKIFLKRRLFWERERERERERPCLNYSNFSIGQKLANTESIWNNEICQIKL
jgi:hypothetical protein